MQYHLIYDIYTLQRGAGYTSRIFDEVLRRGNAAVIFRDKQIAEQAIYYYFTGLQHSMGLPPTSRKEVDKIFASRNISILTLSDMGLFHTLRGREKSVVFLDNSLLLYVGREFGRLEKEKERLEKENARLRPLRTYLSPDHYWKTLLRRSEERADNAELIIGFWIPFWCTLSFYLIITIYLVYAFLTI